MRLTSAPSSFRSRAPARGPESTKNFRSHGFRVRADARPGMTMGGSWPLLRQVLDLVIPLRQQAAAFRRRTIFGEVVVDQLDVAETRRLLGQERVLVGRHLERDVR